MKKKWFVGIVTILMFVLCAIGLAACGDKGGSVDGMYYPYENGSYDKTSWLKLKGDEWSTNSGDSGTFEVKGEEIVIYIDLYGSKQIFSKGTVKDGVLTMTTAGITKTFCKDGAKPSSSPSTPSKPSTEKVTITYNANGGKFASGSETYSQSADKDALLTAPDSPTRTGYTFAGWAKSKLGSEMWKFDEDRAESGVTLYAKWTEKSAVILSVDGASIEGNNIFMLVDKDTEAVSLSNKVVCSSDSVWRLYYDRLGQTEIPTKMAAGLSGVLANGNNTFYMVVTSQDGVQTNLYELTVHRQYVVPITYIVRNSVYKSESVLTGSVLTNNFDIACEIKGYDFVQWTGKAWNTSIWEPVTLTAELAPYTYTVSYNANGGSGAIASTTIKSGESLTINSGSAYKRNFYELVGFNTKADGTGLAISLNAVISDYNFAQDLTLFAVWDSEFIYTSSSVGITITGIKNKNYSTIEIPDTIDDKTVIGIAESAFKNYTSLRNLSIPNSVKFIEEAAFSGCGNLINITIPFVGGSVKTASDYWQYPFGYIFGTSSYTGGTAVKQYYYGSSIDSSINTTYYIPTSLKSVTVTGGNILHGAFYNCSGFTSITIGNSITSIGSGAFYNCNGLTRINYTGTVAEWCDISGLDYLMSNSRTLYIGGEELRGELVIPDGVTIIKDYAFYSCSKLTSITIPNSVMSIEGYAFYDCSGLESITVDESNPNYASQDGILYNKAKTEYIYISKAIKGAVTIPNSMTSIGNGAFSGRSGLTSITIGNSVTTIGNEAFYNCNGLTSITVGNSVTTIGNEAFSNCNGLTRINYTGTVAEWCGISGLGNLMSNSRTLYIDGEELRGELVIPEGVTGIREYAFSGCSGLMSITIPNSVTSIGNSAFNGCSGLTSITVPFVGGSVKTASSTTHQYLFGYIFGTSSYTGGTAIKQYYYDSTGISRSIMYYIPTSLKSVTVIGGNILYSAFCGCSGLTSITIPNSVTSIGEAAFHGCSGLTGTLTIPNSVTSIEESAFYGCSGLTGMLTIPNSVTTIGGSAFSGCNGITGITIGNSVTSIGRYAFNGCSGIIQTENDVQYVDNWMIECNTSVISVALRADTVGIADKAFYGCGRLTSIIIPSSVTNIGSEAFYNCRGLTSVYYGGTVADWDKIKMSGIVGSNSSFTSATRYYYYENESDVPTDSGNYWHYDSTGEIVIWFKED